jgi:hypothetical protein
MPRKNLALTAIRSAHFRVHGSYLATTVPEIFTKKQVRRLVQQTSKHPLHNSQKFY